MDRVIESYARVTGGEQYLSNESTRVLQKALDLAKKMQDQFVSVEHILLSMVSAKDQIGKMLMDFGANEKDLLSIIQSLRKGSKVNSQTAPKIPITR